MIVRVTGPIFHPGAKMQVVILRGIPGSGKSTLVQKRFPTATVVSADHFFVDGGVYRFDPSKLSLAHQACWRDFFAAVQANEQTIVVDNTGTSIAEIAPYVLPAEANRYEVKIITITCDPAIAFSRNVHGVPAHVIAMMAKRLQEQTALIPPWWSHETIGN